MNNHDPLEAELATLRPVPPSPQLRDRIAGELNTRSLLPQATSNGDPARQAAPTWAFVSGMLAASILALLFWSTMQRAPKRPLTERHQRGQETGRNESNEITAALNPALPSLWTYRRALSAGPHELDALLTEHAQHGRSVPTPAHDLQIGPTRGFVSSEATFHSFIQGDL